MAVCREERHSSLSIICWGRSSEIRYSLQNTGSYMYGNFPYSDSRTRKILFKITEILGDKNRYS